MAKAKTVTALDIRATTLENARLIAHTRLEELYAWDRYIDNPYAIHELHNLRIATKRLRYTFEIFENVFPVACRAIIKELEQIQEELGALHDSDVMIALVRLCLGSQDSGTAYERALAKAKTKRQAKDKFILRPELVADLVDPNVAPSIEERYGLEQMLLKLERSREEQYTAFRQHWYQLSARGFRREILSLLGA